MNTGAPPPVDTFEGPFIDVIVESWRFTRTFVRVLTRLDAGEAARYHNQLRFYQKRLEDALASTGLKIVNLEGQYYEAGMAATALNIADFGAEELLLVDQMIEPVIMGANGLRRVGTVTLRRATA